MGARDWGIFGREAEMAKISAILDKASAGEGRAFAVVGEAGVGKTRLVSEAVRVAKMKGFRIIEGSFSQNSSRPYEAFCKALGDDLVQNEEHVTFAQVLVIDQSGLLVAKAVPQGADDVDSDIFAGMLTAVQNFVKDSFGGGEGSLGRLEYGEMKIVMESMGSAILVAFFRGTEHTEMAPFVRSGAKRIAGTYGTLLETWGGRTESVSAIQREIEKMAAARFLVRRDLAGVKLDKERLRVADLILSRLQNLAKIQPVLLTLEDFHWAEEGSIDALGYLARNASQSKLTVMATARLSESQKMDAALKSMASEGDAYILDMGGISADAVSGLLAKEFSPNDFPPEFSSRIASECRGNPFFLTEALRQMLADGTINHADGRYSLLSADTPLPKTVDELVQRRLDSLDPDAIALAEYASCAGREFPVSAALSMRSLKDASFALEKLREAGIVSISESGTGEFSHAFYRDAIYCNIVPRWKNVYHKGLGEHYERAYDGKLDEAAYELARHFSMTAEKPKAVRYGIMAGEKAEAAYAAERAVAFYRSVLDTMRGGPSSEETNAKRAELGQRVGELLALTGDYDGALSMYQDVLSFSKEPETRARMNRLMSDINANRGENESALKHLDEAKKELGETVSAELGRIITATSYIEREMGHFDKGIESDKVALAIFERLGGLEKDVVTVLNSMGSGYWRKGDYDKSLEYYQKALAMSERLGLERKAAAQHANIGNIYGDRGDLANCIANYEMALKFFNKTGDVRSIAIMSNNLAICHADMGSLDKAQEYYWRGINIYKRLGDVRMLSSTYANLGIVFYYMGDIEKAIEHVSEGIRVAESRGGEAVYIAAHLTSLGVLYLDKGESEKARNYQERAKKIASETGNKNILVSAYSGLAAIELAEGRLGDARELADKTLALSREIGVKDSEIEALTLHGILDFRAKAFDSGRRNFEAALEASSGFGMAGKQADVRLAYGRELIQAGFPEEAKPMLEKAASQFLSVKMNGKVAATQALLAKLK
jgi:tetratricopeptide (TPR) repeat protein/predicted regulator of Ras-like GTPase activity (Roadblock/LC7/MglB family)